MQNPFRKAASPVSEAEQALKSWGIGYEIKPDGSLRVPGNLNISNKHLTRLPDLSEVKVGANFWCDTNQLTSLAGAPPAVGGDFYCHDNQLTSLEHAPRKFQKLKSDFGEFSCWEAVPEELRISPETKSRREQNRLTAATVLQSAMTIKGPLRLRPH